MLVVASGGVFFYIFAGSVTPVVSSCEAVAKLQDGGSRGPVPVSLRTKQMAVVVKPMGSHFGVFGAPPILVYFRSLGVRIGF